MQHLTNWENALRSLRHLFPQAANLLTNRTSINPDWLCEVVVAQGLCAEWEFWGEDAIPDSDVDALRALIGNIEVLTGDIYILNHMMGCKMWIGPQRVSASELIAYAETYRQRYHEPLVDLRDLVIWCESPARLIIYQHHGYVLAVDIDNNQSDLFMDSEAEFKELETSVRVLEKEALEARTPEEHDRLAIRRQALLEMLNYAGVLGGRPQTSALSWTSDMVTERLRAGDYPLLASYNAAGATLREYYSHPERDGGDIPVHIWQGPISVDWFRSGPLRPPKEPLYAWTARCERALRRHGADALKTEIILGHAGTYFLLQVRRENGHLALAGVEELLLDDDEA